MELIFSHTKHCVFQWCCCGEDKPNPIRTLRKTPGGRSYLFYGIICIPAQLTKPRSEWLHRLRYPTNHCWKTVLSSQVYAFDTTTWFWVLTVFTTCLLKLIVNLHTVQQQQTNKRTTKCPDILIIDEADLHWILYFLILRHLKTIIAILEVLSSFVSVCYTGWMLVFRQYLTFRSLASCVTWIKDFVNSYSPKESIIKVLFWYSYQNSGILW